MGEHSFASKFISQAPHTEPESDWRRAFTVERDGSAQPFCLSVRSQNGRGAIGIAMSLYLRHWWLDDGGRMEKLILLFSNGAIYLEGQHLQRGVDALEEGKLKRIQEQSSNEVSLIKGRNADVRKAEDKEPFVSRIVVMPSLQHALENDETLAEITNLVKEEYGNHSGNDQSAA
jgi:hypothetical protein